MKFPHKLPEQLEVGRYLLKWFLLALLVALGVGSMVALFLYLLELATHYRIT